MIAQAYRCRWFEARAGERLQQALVPVGARARFEIDQEWGFIVGVARWCDHAALTSLFAAEMIVEQRGMVIGDVVLSPSPGRAPTPCFFVAPVEDRDCPPRSMQVRILPAEVVEVAQVGGFPRPAHRRPPNDGLTLIFSGPPGGGKTVLLATLQDRKMSPMIDVAINNAVDVLDAPTKRALDIVVSVDGAHTREVRVTSRGIATPIDRIFSSAAPERADPQAEWAHIVADWLFGAFPELKAT